MAYLHEMALKKAIQNLHMFGSSDAKRPKTNLHGFEEGASAMGSSIAAAMKHHPKSPENHGPTEVTNSVGQNMMSGFTGGQRVAVNQDGTPNYDSVSDVPKRIQANEEAKETRMGGYYTPQGLQSAEGRADANAADLLHSRALIGIGGTRRY